jgi:hypothetical protein
MSALCNSVQMGDLVRVADGFTSITVMPDELPHLHLTNNGLNAPDPRDRTLAHPASTGARVTMEFITDIQVLPNREVHACYDIAGNGSWRECMGIPNLTHTTQRPEGDGTVYHYRLSHWIAASSVMRFVQQ